MKILTSWVLAVFGVSLQEPITSWIIEYLPYMSDWSKEVSDIVKTVSAIIGLFFLWRAYQLKTQSVKEKKARTAQILAETKKTERETAAIIISERDEKIDKKFAALEKKIDETNPAN